MCASSERPSGRTFAWTARPAKRTPTRRPANGSAISAGAIRDWNSPEGDGLLSTRETARRHARDRAFIEAEIAAAHEAGLKTVVITHHAPSPRSIHPRFAGDECNPGFASNLEAMIQRFQPALWVHGHVHNAVDEQLGRTRILANPRGYDRAEAMDFVPDLVVEL